MYEWIPVNLILKGNLAIVASHYIEIEDKSWPDGPLESYTDFTLNGGL